MFLDAIIIKTHYLFTPNYLNSEQTALRTGMRMFSPEGIFSESEKTKIGKVKVKMPPRASLVAQWLRIHLPMQGTWVRSLVREDPTCCGTTKPVRHNY